MKNSKWEDIQVHPLLQGFVIQFGHGALSLFTYISGPIIKSLYMKQTTRLQINIIINKW
jgi:hypothetical protein